MRSNPLVTEKVCMGRGVVYLKMYCIFVYLYISSCKCGRIERIILQNVPPCHGELINSADCCSSSEALHPVIISLPG